MRRTRFVAALLALLGATTAHAGLKAKIDVDKAWLGPHDDVVARVVLTNTGSTDERIPRWRVPGRVLETNLFDISRDGQSVAYMGRLVKRGEPGPSDFVTLKPGHSFRFQVELTRHYDMNDGGEYVIAYRFDDADDLGAAVSEAGRRPANESNSVAIWRDAPVGPRVDWAAMNAPAGEAGTVTTIGCGSSDNVTGAISGAKSYSTGAKSYMQSHTASTVGARYTTWFGSPTASYVSAVTSHYVAIEDAFLNKAVTIDCTCTDSYYAYVYPNDPYHIYVCNAYRSAPTTGTDSKAGTLVHEMSHFYVTASTDDWAYGKSACMKLAKRANKATDNADSHEYFAENTPSQN